MQIDFLIIGQGISGTFLSYYLEKEGRSFLVIDNNDANAPSRIAGGIINPVTGRRLVKVWMVEQILPFAWQAYNEIGKTLNISAISQKNLIDFFPNPHQRQVFLERIAENDQYLHSFSEQNQFNPYFNYELGCGEIRHCYVSNPGILLPAWRKHLKDMQGMLEEEFEPGKLNFHGDSVQYNDITAQKLIFCDGPAAATHSFFSSLPFAPNKGESLIVEIPELPDQHIYKKGFMLAPLEESELFWLGSNYLWHFDDPHPSKAFYEQAERHLKAWLKIPFRILDHRAALRPATLERRPFVGIHPHKKNIGILNGMGTKGSSLAPYFAHQLTNYLLHEEPIQPEADVARFSKILSRDFNS
jgi:glycine/D-amino acid oxidase-like deaminating enzyme